MANNNLYNLTNEEEYKKILVDNKTSLFVVNFWAEWAETCKHMNEVFLELSSRYPKVIFINVEAEKFPSIAEAFEISAVPAFKIFHNGRLLSTISGPNAPELTSQITKALENIEISKKNITPNKVSTLSNVQSQQVEISQELLEEKLKQLINQSEVMLFMKGNPETPQCGFSRKIVTILQENEVKFNSFDILSDQQVREGLKKFSDWPTYPQLYVKGELVGGLDIVKEMIATGEFKDILKS